MNKDITELVARAIYDKKIYKISTEPYAEANVRDYCHNYAQAAITTLETKYHLIPKDEIIELEWDAEPEVGDRVLSKTNTHFESFTVDEVENGYVKTSYMAGGYNAKSEEFKIIQRNGKPVIMKPKPEEK